jgi:hypothetical protein
MDERNLPNLKITLAVQQPPSRGAQDSFADLTYTRLVRILRISRLVRLVKCFGLLRRTEMRSHQVMDCRYGGFQKWGIPMDAPKWMVYNGKSH